MTVLDTIVSRKKAEVERAKRRLPTAVLRELVARAPSPRDMLGALTKGTGPRIIAEVKRASPSKGALAQANVSGWQPEDLAQSYCRAGAAALSVLTDTHFFWGSFDSLVACRDVVDIPVLRKDFVVDSYQLLESRWLGADAVLLIASIHSPNDLQKLADEAQSLGMNVLLEIHDVDELPKALAVREAMIGINQRDLRNQQIISGHAAAVSKQVPSSRIVVAESGIRTADDVAALCRVGVTNFLVGESLVASEDPFAALSALLEVDY